MSPRDGAHPAETPRDGDPESAADDEIVAPPDLRDSRGELITADRVRDAQRMLKWTRTYDRNRARDLLAGIYDDSVPWLRVVAAVPTLRDAARARAAQSGQRDTRPRSSVTSPPDAAHEPREASAPSGPAAAEHAGAELAAGDPHVAQVLPNVLVNTTAANDVATATDDAGAAEAAPAAADPGAPPKTVEIAAQLTPSAKLADDTRRRTPAATNGRAALPLSDEHIAHLRTSGLTDETLALAGLYTERDIDKLTDILGVGYPSCRGTAIVIPLIAPDATEPHAYRIRPDHPRTQERNSKQRKIKYDQASRAGQLVYFPPRARAGGWYRDASRTLCWCEGEKKGLALDQLGFACVTLTGCWNFLDPARNKKGPHIIDPQIAKHVAIAGRDHVIVLDADYRENKDVRTAARSLGSLLYALGAATVKHVSSDVEGAKGVDDHLALCGEAATRAMLARTRLMRLDHAAQVGIWTARASANQVLDAERQHALEGFVDSGQPPADAEQQPQNASANSTTRQELELSVNWTEVAAEAIRILATSRDRPVYQRGGRLVHVTRDAFAATIIAMPPGAPYIRNLHPVVLGEVLTSVASITKVVDGGVVRTTPPSWLTRLLCERGEWPGVPPLVAAIEHPVLRPDGTVLVQPGYDAVTGLLYEPRGVVPTVPDAPSHDDAVAARKLLESVVSDFPLKSGAHCSGWLAFVLTIVARYAFSGPTPLFLHDASTRGSGKTKLAHLAAIIATGHDPAKRQLPRNDDAETRKLVTTIAMTGPRCVLLDNVIGELGGGVLCDLLTSTCWGDRILGLNASYDGPWLSVMSASGNNVRLGPDMDRRVQHIRLEPQVESPEKRTDFVRPDLIGWVRAEQPRLLAAALTILRAYAVAGRPHVEFKPRGSYEEWSRAVSAPLIWSGAPDPAGANEDLAAAASTDEAAARLVRGWNELTLTHGPLPTGRALRLIYPDVTPHDLDERRDPYPLLREALEELHPHPHGRHISSGALGRLLGTHRGRVFGNLVLRSRISEGSTLWSAVRVGGAGEAPP